MKFFKYGKDGEVIAIVLPDKMRKSSEVSADDDFEFFEVEKGTFILISKKNLEDAAKKSAWAQLLKGNAPQMQSEQNMAQAAPKPYHTEPNRSSEIRPATEIRDDLEPEKAIAARGFAVISSEEEARRISKLFEKEIKANEIMGVRGFDKKFYIVSAKYYKENSSRLLKTLGSREMPLSELASALKLDEKGCLACLMLLKEQGDIIEKRRGVFKTIK